MTIKVSRGASLDRYYLFKYRGYGVFLHKIHGSDPEGLFHSHPWNGLSLILGSYKEYFIDGKGHARVLANFIRGSRHHRVEIQRPVWTLFFHLPKSNKWSICNKEGTVVSEAPWEGDKGYKDYSKAVA